MLHAKPLASIGAEFSRRQWHQIANIGWSGHHCSQPRGDVAREFRNGLRAAVRRYVSLLFRNRFRQTLGLMFAPEVP